MALHIMCKRDTESVKVAPKSVLSNGGNLQGTGMHLTREGSLRVRFSPRGYLWGGGLSPGGVISVHRGRLFKATAPATQNARLPTCSLVLGTTKSPQL